MPETFNLFFDKKFADYTLTLVVSGILFWIVNLFGLGYTFDSHLYVEIAQEIGSSNFFSVEGFNVKPPVLPLIISIVGEKSMIWVNFICYLIIQYFGVFWSYKIKDNSLRYTFLVVLIFSTPHLLINSFLWTEPVFLTFMLFAFYLLDEFHQSNSKVFIVLAIIILGFLPFIRFAGIFIIIPFFGFLLFHSKSKQAILYTFAVIILLIVGWSFLFQDGFSGRWERFLAPFLTGSLDRIEFNLSSYSKALSSWFFPYAIDGFLSRFLSLAIVVTVLYKSAKMYFKKPEKIIFLAPILFVIYCFLMISVFKVEYYAAERYLAVFYLLLVLNIFYLIDYHIPSFKSKIGKRVLFFFVILFAAYNFFRLIKNVYFWFNLRSNSFTMGEFDGFLMSYV